VASPSPLPLSRRERGFAASPEVGTRKWCPYKNASQWGLAPPSMRAPQVQRGQAPGGASPQRAADGHAPEFRFTFGVEILY
jgi:hypothetical protein